ncbi:MAG: hypothetical protein CME62_03855 [Halobacteriovoraceae bacterium]|nr:hypothetical protein [Halobacteriovoraceae bacterium]
MKKILNNQNGLSLMELTIALGLVGIVSYGTLNMMGGVNKMSSDFDKTSNVLFVEKSISNYLLSKEGCMQFVGWTKSLASSNESFRLKKMSKKMVDGKIQADFTDSAGNPVVMYEEGQVIADVKLKEMKVKGLEFLNAKEDSGILTVGLLFQARDENKKFTSESREFQKFVHVPVGMSVVGGVNQVTDCELNKAEIYEDISEKLCTEVFFRDTSLSVDDSLKTCAQTTLFVVNEIKQSICEDVTGSAGNFDSATGICNFANSHAGKSCGGGTKMTGFNATGGIVCL